MSPRVWVIVPAAGVGSRMGTALPKQYLPLGPHTVLQQTLQILVSTPKLAGIVVCLHQEDSYFETLAVNSPLVKTTVGGKERSDTVSKGLASIATQVNAGDWVLVHDAARPCLTTLGLQQFVQAVWDGGIGGILALPVADTLKRVDPNTHLVMKTQSRVNVWQAQTPQMFRYSDLNDALHMATAKALAITDEASAMELMGKPVQIFQGSADNIKITQPADLCLAALILQAQKQK